MKPRQPVRGYQPLKMVPIPQKDILVDERVPYEKMRIAPLELEGQYYFWR